MVAAACIDLEIRKINGSCSYVRCLRSPATAHRVCLLWRGAELCIYRYVAGPIDVGLRPIAQRRLGWGGGGVGWGGGTTDRYCGKM